MMCIACIAVRRRVVAGVILGLTAVSAVVAVPAAGYDPSRAGMQRLIVAEAAAADVPAALALAVAREASDFNHHALNAAGQVGVMQVLPATAAREFGVSAEQLRDPVTNVRVGLHYLARLHQRYDGDWGSSPGALPGQRSVATRGRPRRARLPPRLRGPGEPLVATLPVGPGRAGRSPPRAWAVALRRRYSHAGTASLHRHHRVSCAGSLAQPVDRRDGKHPVPVTRVPRAPAGYVDRLAAHR